MKYFIDTEFIEWYSQWVFVKNRPFIDLISIGIVAEDGRTYYAISNQFNPDDASKWVKDNVLYPIMLEYGFSKNLSNLHGCLSYSKMAVKSIQKHFGKHPATIGYEIMQFCGGSLVEQFAENDIQFYGYFADYDWVVFCAMFGRMIDLPKGFPMYCRDLKQMLDERVEKLTNSDFIGTFHIEKPLTFKEKLKMIKEGNLKYPKQGKEHNALDDAMWNKKLYEFIQTL